MDLSKPAGEPGLEGDLASSCDLPWLMLTGKGTEIVLFAKRELVFGKMIEPPVDVCLRLYPVTAHREACLKVSRQHLRLVVEPHRVVLGDLGSGNGTLLDHVPLAASKPMTLETGRDHALKVADVLAMSVRVEPRSGPPQRALANAAASDGRAPCGLDSDAPVDAIILRRQDNRTGLVIAQVVRRLTIGSPQAMVPIAGVTGAVLELALYCGRWLWRDIAANGSWRPLRLGDSLPLPAAELKVTTGTYNVFQE